MHNNDRKNLGTAPLKGDETIRDMSKWDKMFKHKGHKQLAPEIPEEKSDNIGFKLNTLNKDVFYKNPYERGDFINRISHVFEQANLEIQNQLVKKSSHISIASLKAQQASRSAIEKRRISRLEGSSDRWSASTYGNRSTSQKLPEAPPLIISDYITQFLKSRSIEEIFKDICPQMFKPPEQEKIKPTVTPKPKMQINKVKKDTTKSQIKPKTCSNCAICKQLVPRPSNGMHPYMIKMQCQHKKNELRSYYKQMMLRNCQLERNLQAQRHPREQFCHAMS